jgi:hypothetical protein
MRGRILTLIFPPYSISLSPWLSIFDFSGMLKTSKLRGLFFRHTLPGQAISIYNKIVKGGI